MFEKIRASNQGKAAAKEESKKAVNKVVASPVKKSPQKVEVKSMPLLFLGFIGFAFKFYPDTFDRCPFSCFILNTDLCIVFMYWMCTALLFRFVEVPSLVTDALNFNPFMCLAFSV